MICPYCKIEIDVLHKHINRCTIKHHYTIINKGNEKCVHEFLNISMQKTIKTNDKCRVIIIMKCMYCNLEIKFDTFETIWLPNLKDIQ